MKNEDIKCKEHPDAPHGFMRDASHSAGRYVCECEFWEPQGVKIHAGPYGEAWIAQDDPLLATKREWVGLTDAEKEKLVETFYGTDIQRLEAVEAKLKEKNT
jgi:hypothetical protein